MERLESNSISTGNKAANKKSTKAEERKKIEKVVKNRVQLGKNPLVKNSKKLF